VTPGRTAIINRYGKDKFDDKFSIDAPINPSTGKHFGEDTQKYENWARRIKAEGRIPVYPAKYAIASTAIDHTLSQMADGFLDPLPVLLAKYGIIGRQETARIQGSNCYAHADKLVDETLCRVIMAPTLDYVTSSEYNYWRLENIIFPLAFQWMVFTAAGISLKSESYAIIAEYSSTYRVTIRRIRDTSYLAETFIEKVLTDLNKALDSKDMSVWKSNFHDIDQGFILPMPDLEKTTRAA